MDISMSLLGAFSPLSNYDYNETRPIPYTQASVAGLIDAGNLQGLMTAVNDLTAYEAAARSYYDGRVSRTSGGKRSRLKGERADVCNEALAAIRLATAGINTVQANIAASAKAKLPAYVDNNTTNQTWTTPGYTNNPTNAIPPDPSMNHASGLSPMATLAIPLGLAAAAFLLIKGH